MRKESLSIFINFGLYLLLFFISPNLFAQSPSAEVVSGDTTVCETGEIVFKVKFTGTAPFGIGYIISDEYGSTKYTKLKQSDAIRSEDMDGNNVWTEVLPINFNSTISIEKVFDATIPLTAIVDGEPAWDYSKGIIITDEEMDILVDREPTPNAGIDISKLCGFIATLDATPENASNTYYWLGTPDGTFANVNDSATTFEANDFGTFTLFFVEESGVCITSDSVIVELLGSPEATLSGNDTICSTDGNPTQIELTISYNSSFAPYSYTVSDGINSYDRNNISVTPDVFNVVSTDNQNFIITSMNDIRSGQQCYSVEGDAELSGNAVVTNLKPAAYTGEDKIVCGELLINLEATLENLGNSGEWTAVSGDISFVDATSPNTITSSTTHGIYPMTWTETEPVMGCADSNVIEINFAGVPVLTYSKDTAICKGSTATLQLNTSGNKPWTLTYTVDANSTDLVLNTSSETEEFSPEISITVDFDSIVGTYGCVTLLKDESYIITVDEMPIANAGMYDPVCSDEIQLNAVPSITNTSGYWQGNGTFDDLNSSSTGFTSAIYGEQSLTWTETNSKNTLCTSFEVVTTRFDQMPLAPIAGDDKELYLEFSTTLDAAATDVGTGTWSASNPEITFDNPNIPNAIADNLKMGVQTLTWTVGNGVCEDQADDIEIEVKGLTNPTGFSPNGDGVNDFFKIMGGQQIPGNELKVFDRKGKVVYSAKNYNNNWDGTGMDGSPLDDGTYYYIFTGDNFDPIKEYLIIKTE